MHTEYMRLGTIADELESWMAKLGITDPEYIDGHESDWYRVMMVNEASGDLASDLSDATITKLTDADLAETDQCAHCDAVVPVVTMGGCSHCPGNICPDCGEYNCPELEATE